MRGVPIVMETASGLPKLIVHGDNGLMVPAGRLDPMADALVSIAKASDVCRRLGRNARTTVTEGYSKAAMADSYAEVPSDVFTELKDRSYRRPRPLAKSSSGLNERVTLPSPELNSAVWTLANIHSRI